MTVPDYDEDDRDAPLDQDIANDDDDDENVAPCPSCGREVYDDADQCPHCGDWIVSGAGAGGLSPVWILAAVLAIAAMIVISVF